jgi:glycosyltransferase involved in cell wall biosynthesis
MKQKNKKKFTIIIPTKDRIKSLKELVNSIDKSINHSNFKLNNFELIIINDGKKYVSITTEIKLRIIKNSKKRGPGYSKNKGSSYSNGDYLIFFDDDIIIPRDYFNILEDIIKVENPDILGPRIYPKNRAATSIFFALLLSNTRKFGFFSASNLIIKQKFFKRYKFTESIRFGEDYKYFLDIVSFRPKVVYSKKLSIIHEETSFFQLIKGINNYAKAYNKISKQLGLEYYELNQNEIIERDDGISFRKLYQNLNIFTKGELLFLYIITIIIFILNNPRFLKFKEILSFINDEVLPEKKFISLNNIPGWFSIIEGKACIKHLKKTKIDGHILEIGHFCGKSTIYLSKGIRKNEKIFSIDKHSTKIFSGKTISNTKIPLHPQKIFLENINKYNLEDKVIAFFCDSKKIPVAIEQERFRFILVDGSHDYNDVKRDFHNYTRFLKKDGIIAFHDANGIYSHVGPRILCIEIKENNSRYKLIDKKGSIIFFKKIK